MENPNLETGEVNLFDPAVAACPQPIYRRMLAGCPVARAALTGGPIIARYEDVTWALRHPEIFSSKMDLQLALGYFYNMQFQNLNQLQTAEAML